ncbi:hypothetical protein WA158_005693 [Blastocystis sp. Blastoise]
MSLLLILFIIVFILCLLIVFLYYNFKRNGSPKKDQHKVMVVLGSGGHTTEMLSMISKLNPDRYNPFVFLIAETDTQSENLLHNANLPFKYSVQRIKRSREVGQSYFSSIFTTLNSFTHSLKTVYMENPSLLLINGPGTCIPIFIWIILLRSINVLQCKTIFVESFCRVENLSLSGKIAYPLADVFIVQWKQLLQKHNKAKYIGILV